MILNSIPPELHAAREVTQNTRLYYQDAVAKTRAAEMNSKPESVISRFKNAEADALDEYRRVCARHDHLLDEVKQAQKAGLSFAAYRAQQEAAAAANDNGSSDDF